ncbi:hypothetical protein FP742_07750 [Vibrio parahaemolyticus]|uniref:Uncharacterized protein n=2 Tax=Vibrio parahaemolyticus TaxID=670 RepID=A0A2R9VJ51_VIBPH|nr:hypothetical protein A6J30_08620 [Vibrio parahaemolyticus]OMC61031.1 hypothetical protein CFSAN001595_0205310 [Vibrio parahaemolyticus CFSAN001595]BAC58300.1 hypothetical protein [Vibrio parahaemolyticus RIMD 2210633]ATI46650.1 hypothetical protein CO725_13475 [Vibrio parahaemolyticus]AVW93748.1 hypothetical protein DA442_00175 [Vibrio parahaemolyticus]
MIRESRHLDGKKESSNKKGHRSDLFLSFLSLFVFC